MLVLGCYVSAANVADVKAPAVLVWVLEMYQRIAKILADQGYRGELGQHLEQVYECQVEIVERQGAGFQVQPKRFERTWSWLECTSTSTRL